MSTWSLIGWGVLFLIIEAVAGVVFGALVGLLTSKRLHCFFAAMIGVVIATVSSLHFGLEEPAYLAMFVLAIPAVVIGIIMSSDSAG